MTDESFKERVQMKLAVLIFICIVYPIKHIIHPLLKILYENIYAVFCLFLMWVTFFIIGSPSEVNLRMKEKIISEHLTIDWMIQPLLTINSFEINIFTIITVMISGLFIYKIYHMFSEVWGVIKMWLGHILMISLWGWFTLIGDEKNSMLCLRSSNEKRALIWFYAFILICIIFVIGMYVLQGHMTNFTLDLYNASHVTEGNLETTSNMTIIPMNISLGSIGDIL